jgi:hypothetical protein
MVVVVSTSVSHPTGFDYGQQKASILQWRLYWGEVLSIAYLTSHIHRVPLSRLCQLFVEFLDPRGSSQSGCSSGQSLPRRNSFYLRR